MMRKINASLTSSTVNVGSPPRKRQLTDSKISFKTTSPHWLPVVARSAVLVRKPPDTARTTTPSKTKRRLVGPLPMAVSPTVLVGHWLETAREIVAQEAKRHLDASEINDRSVKRFRQDERKRPSEVSVSGSSTTSSRPLPVIRPVNLDQWFETAHAVVAYEAIHRLDASDDNDRSAKRYRPDDRKLASEVSSGPTRLVIRLSYPVASTPVQKPSPAPKLASDVSSGPTRLIVHLSYPVATTSGQLATPVDTATPRRSAIPIAVSGQSALTVTGNATLRQKPFDAPKLASDVSSGPTHLIIRLSYPVASTPVQKPFPAPKLASEVSSGPTRSIIRLSYPVATASGQPATRVDAATLRRSAIPIAVPGHSAVTVTGTATSSQQPVTAPRLKTVAAPKQRSVDGPLPLSAMSLLFRRNNTGVLGSDGGDDEYDLPAFSSEGVDGGELEPPADRSSLPLPPSQPHVGVIALGPTSARVAWDVGQPATRADGTPAETAPVLRYEIYVCRDRVAADPASSWLMMAHAEPPPAAATDGSGDLMYRDITGLPTDERLYFAVVPVDVYGRQAVDFDVAGVTLKA